MSLNVFEIADHLERANTVSARYLQTPLSLLITARDDELLVEFDLPSRAFSAFQRLGWETVGDLKAKKLGDMIPPGPNHPAYRLIGRKTAAEIIRVLGAVA